MPYTVFGIFTNKKEHSNVIEKLEDAGLYDYTVSHYEKTTLDNVEDNAKKGFWHWLFDNNDLEEDRYQYASVGSDTITVYTDTEEDANAAKNILDENGAIDIEEKTRDYISGKYKDVDSGYPISESKRARIIAKAKNNLYFTETPNANQPAAGGTDTIDASLGVDEES